jgi:hypothetical protein
MKDIKKIDALYAELVKTDFNISKGKDDQSTHLNSLFSLFGHKNFIENYAAYCEHKDFKRKVAAINPTNGEIAKNVKGKTLFVTVGVNDKNRTFKTFGSIAIKVHKVDGELPKTWTETRKRYMEILKATRTVEREAEKLGKALAKLPQHAQKLALDKLAEENKKRLLAEQQAEQKIAA